VKDTTIHRGNEMELKDLDYSELVAHIEYFDDIMITSGHTPRRAPRGEYKKKLAALPPTMKTLYSEYYGRLVEGDDLIVILD
jgi:hypothetical protein